MGGAEKQQLFGGGADVRKRLWQAGVKNKHLLLASKEEARSDASPHARAATTLGTFLHHSIRNPSRRKPFKALNEQVIKHADLMGG